MSLDFIKVEMEWQHKTVVVRLSVKTHARENGSFWGVRLVVLWLWWGPEGSEMWEFPFSQVNDLGLSKKKCLG